MGEAGAAPCAGLSGRMVQWRIGMSRVSVTRSRGGLVSRVGLGCALLVCSQVAAAQGPTAVMISVPAARTAALGKPKLTEASAQVRFPDARPEQLAVRQAVPVRSEPKVSSENGGATITVKKGDQIVVQKAGIAPAPVALAQKTKQLLPSTLLVGVSDANDNVAAKQLQPFLLAEVSPLRWDASLKEYAMTLLVGLDPVAGDASEQPLPLTPPIVFQITGENVDGIKPNQPAVLLAGPSGYQRILVLTRNFSAPIKVNAHSTVGDGSFSANVDPGPSWLELGQSDDAIDGLGLGKTTISVRQRAANGDLLPATDLLHVALKTSVGALSPPYVEIAAHHSDGETSLVSSAWGAAVVSEAGAADGAPHVANVAFKFPWLKVLFGLVGAALAGGIRVLKAARAKQSWLPTFVGCLASGIAIDILIALGAPLAPAPVLALIRSELAWFAIGLVAGFPGTAALEWAGNKLFGFAKEPTGQT